MAAIDDSFNADAGDADTASYGEGAQLEKVESDASKGGVGNGTAAEGEV